MKRWTELTAPEKTARLTAGRSDREAQLERNRIDDETDVNWNDNRIVEEDAE